MTRNSSRMVVRAYPRSYIRRIKRNFQALRVSVSLVPLARIWAMTTRANGLSLASSAGQRSGVSQAMSLTTSRASFQGLSWSLRGVGSAESVITGLLQQRVVCRGMANCPAPSLTITRSREKPLSISPPSKTPSVAMRRWRALAMPKASRWASQHGAPLMPSAGHWASRRRSGSWGRPCSCHTNSPPPGAATAPGDSGC